MLTYKYNQFQSTVEFSEKPTADIIGLLKCDGFRWNPQTKEWYHPRGRMPNLDYLSKLIDKANNVRRPDAACWLCGDPNGYFRNRGAATPVYCDKCAELHP